MPVYLTGAFQDEQTGAQFNTMVDNFDRSPALRVALWNGRHPDGYAPSNIVRWFEFLEFYVAERVPKLHPVIRAAAAPILRVELRSRDTELERDRWPFWFGTDYQAALRGYEAEQPVRVIFESGIGGNERGEPDGHVRVEVRDLAAAAPAGRSPHVVPRDGRAPHRASASERQTSGIDAFRFDPAAGDKTIFETKPYELLDRVWDFDWTRFDEGKQLSYLTDPLADDLVVAGPGYVNPLRRERRHRRRRAGVDLGGAARRHRVPRAERVAPARPSQDRREPHELVGDRSLVRGGRLRAARAGQVRPRQGRDPRVRPRLPRRFPTPVDGGHARPQPRRPGSSRRPDYGGAIPTHRVARTDDMASALVLPVVPGYQVGPRTAPALPVAARDALPSVRAGPQPARGLTRITRSCRGTTVAVVARTKKQ